MAEIICKCGARTYEQHLVMTQSPHTYKPDKASNLVRLGAPHPS